MKKRATIHTVKVEGKYGATKFQAARGAQRLQDLMTSAGWHFNVWKTVGWHYNVSNDWFSVSPSYQNGILRGYRAFLNEWPNSEIGAASYWHSSDEKVFKDPNKAVEEVIKRAKIFLEHITRVIMVAENSIHPEYTKRPKYGLFVKDKNV